ncbi:MAG: MCE family protein [Myxococcales bacterium]|nr:MCE family protein [Myxococcales bacterium]
MTTRAQKIRLGVFMLLAVLILLGSIVTLAGLKLWNPRDRYWVRFKESVSGLETGSTVKMNGVRVGQVEAIRIDEKNVGAVIVTLSLAPKTPVKVDARAVMTAIGITGLKFIELTGGSKKAAVRSPNNESSSWIPEGESTLQSLTGKATDIAKKMESILNNVLALTNARNRASIARLLEHSDDLVVAWTELAAGDAPKRIRNILRSAQRMTRALEDAAKSFSGVAQKNSTRLSNTLVAAEQAARSISRAVRGLRPQKTLDAITGAAAGLRNRINDPAISLTITSLGKAANRIAGLTGALGKMLRRRDRQLSGLLGNLNKAARDLKEFARSIRERPSLLLRGNTRKERPVR